MAINVKQKQNAEREPLRVSVEMSPETYNTIIGLVESGEATSKLAQVVRNWLESLMTDLPDEAKERKKIYALIREAEIDLRVVERVVDVRLTQMPTRGELLAMPDEERRYWLEKAAALAEDFYLNDPELTVTADATELYDYPDS